MSATVQGVTDERPVVFVVDDDADTRQLLMAWLESASLVVEGFADGPALLTRLETASPGAICLDIRMPEMDGIEVLRRLKQIENKAPVVMLTADEQLETAVECMKLGAFDYQVKPMRKEATIGVVRAALREAESSRARSAARVPVDAPTAPARLLGSSNAIRQVVEEVERVALSKVSVFIQGENGTGKELVARAIHERSERVNMPFVVVNCGAIPESLHEQELFGIQEDGQTTAGKIERSSGGTLFLDDISELSTAAQVRLLRALQERSVERVGGRDPISVNLRLISATQHDLASLVDEGKFRHDLFYRLVIYPIDVPALRERIEDLQELFPHFLSRYATELGCSVPSFDAEVVRRLQGYRWAGNVRELENLAQRMVIASRGARITVADLPADIREPASQGGGNAATSTTGTIRSMEDAEREAIVEALRHVGGNVTEAARRLGIGRATLYRKLTRYQIERSSF